MKAYVMASVVFNGFFAAVLGAMAGAGLASAGSAAMEALCLVGAAVFAGGVGALLLQKEKAEEAEASFEAVSQPAQFAQVSAHASMQKAA